MPQLRKIIVLFKTHLDVGFTDLAANVVDRYMTEYIPRALDIAQELNLPGQERRFVWTTGSWLIAEYLRTAPAPRRAAMENAIRRGDVSWHGLPFTLHSELADARLYDYGLGIARELDARYGIHTLGAKNTDVPGHTRAIVPHLARAGIRFLHIGVNAACPAPQVPIFFRWQAPTGEHVAVMYSKGSYGDTAQIPGTDTAVCFAHTNDNCGPQSAQEILEIYQELERRFPGVQASAGNLNDVARVIAAVEDSFPVVTQEIGDTWIHGGATDPGKLSRYRALLRLGASWPSAAAEPLYRHLLLVPEHTWGLDEKTHLADHENYRRADFEAARSRANYQKMEASWQEQRAYVDAAIDALPDPYRAQALQSVSGCKRPRPNLAEFTRVIDPCAALRWGDWTLRWGEDGSLADLVHKDRVLADAGHPWARLSYQAYGKAEFDRFLRDYMVHPFDWAIEDLSKPGCETALPQGGLWFGRLRGLWQRENEFWAEIAFPSEAHTCLGCPASMMLYLRLEDSAMTLEAAWWDKPANRLGEALFLDFHSAATACRVHKLGAWVDAADGVPGGNQRLHGTDYGVWMDGITLTSLDAALVAIGRPSLLEFSYEPPALDQGISFVLYDNVWGTNFPMWYDEDARFRFHIELSDDGGIV